MRYTVQEVAKISHTTIKTLHYYHKIGLLIPEKISDSGYRLYSVADLEKLQQILFYRALSFPLKTIQKVMENPMERGDILLQQKELLEAKLVHFRELIDTIEYTLDGENRGDLEMEKLFKGLQEDEWHEAMTEQSEYLTEHYQYDPTKALLPSEEMNAIAEESIYFQTKMSGYLENLVAPDDSRVAATLKMHLDFLIEHNLLVSTEDFLQQAEFFVTDTFHREMLENVHIGLAYYLQRAAKLYFE